MFRFLTAAATLFLLSGPALAQGAHESLPEMAGTSSHEKPHRLKAPVPAGSLWPVVPGYNSAGSCAKPRMPPALRSAPASSL